MVIVKANREVKLLWIIGNDVYHMVNNKSDVFNRRDKCSEIRPM